MVNAAADSGGQTKEPRANAGSDLCYRLRGTGMIPAGAAIGRVSRSDVMFALLHGRGCIRASRCTSGPNAAWHRLLNCCHFLLRVRQRSRPTPILSRRVTRRRTERTCEVGLARKFEGQRNMGQRLLALPEKLFGELKPLRADIVMRRSADRGLERARKMEAAQARDRSQAGECQIIFKIGFDVIEHTCQSASIEACLNCTGGDAPRRRFDVLLDQPRR